MPDKSYNRLLGAASFGIVAAVNRAAVEGAVFAAVSPLVRTADGAYTVNLSRTFVRPELRVAITPYSAAAVPLTASVIQSATPTQFLIEIRTAAGVPTNAGFDVFIFQGAPTGGTFPLGPV